MIIIVKLNVEFGQVCKLVKCLQYYKKVKPRLFHFFNFFIFVTNLIKINNNIYE